MTTLACWTGEAPHDPAECPVDATVSDFKPRRVPTVLFPTADARMVVRTDDSIRFRLDTSAVRLVVAFSRPMRDTSNNWSCSVTIFDREKGWKKVWAVHSTRALDDAGVRKHCDDVLAKYVAEGIAFALNPPPAPSAAPAPAERTCS